MGQHSFCHCGLWHPQTVCVDGDGADQNWQAPRPTPCLHAAPLQAGAATALQACNHIEKGYCMGQCNAHAVKLAAGCETVHARRAVLA